MSDQGRDRGDSGDDRRSSGSRDRGGMASRTGGGRKFYRRKVCKVCIGKANVDYKDSDSLRRFTTDRGKILPRRITGTCAKHQRLVAREVKRARALALLPFVSK
jgi:small subunit ribosomal protein S18